jgi:hypothetical protein
MLYEMRPPADPVDLHQHAWTEPLLEALSARQCLPFVRRTPEGLTVLHCQGERPYVIDPEDLDGDAGARRRRLGGARHAVIALSSPIGIEGLEPGAAAGLIDAHLDGVLALGPEFPAWGPLRFADPEPGQVDELLDRGCVGISVSAGAVSSHEEFDRLGPTLEEVQRRDAVLFIHPGPGRNDRPPQPALTEPLWWPALTSYVEQMQAAWLTFAAYGRRQLPRLRIVFAMLAGGAPLLSERLAARGGPVVDDRDPLTFFETSSFGPRMVETMARWAGPGQLVYGSDRPVVEPVRTGREVELMSNSAQLLGLGALVS